MQHKRLTEQYLKNHYAFVKCLRFTADCLTNFKLCFIKITVFDYIRKCIWEAHV